MAHRETIPLRLRHQVRLAALLLITAWLAPVLFYWVSRQLQPDLFLALLPGLALALHIQGRLFRWAGANHRAGEPDRLLPTLGGANWVTLLRAGAVVGLAGFLPLTILRGQKLPDRLAWVPGLIYLGISLADLLDGWIARKLGSETDLGRHLDIETDAAGLLAASLVAIGLGRLPHLYLMVGLAYYPFVLGIWMRRKLALPVVALQSRPYARIIAGFQMGLVALALFPLFNTAFTRVAAYLFMTPLLIGFLRDWLVVSCRLETDAAQQTPLDRWSRSWFTRALPPVLRLALLAGGIATLVDGEVAWTHPAWQLAHSLCCLLAGLGVLGRSAALGLALMLGSEPSPFGTSMRAMLLFGSATALMLTGTGPICLWAPEERILYRRKPVRRKTPSETP